MVSKVRLNIGGPKGNAFYILGLVKDLTGGDNVFRNKILKEMKSGDYNHLLKTFTEAFPTVELYSHHILSGVDKDLYVISNDVFEL